MAYAVWELKRRWPQGHKRLLEELRSSAGELSEGVAIPIEADLIDMVPAILDPYLDSGRPDAEAEAVRICAEIEQSLKKHGVWISQTQRKAVTRASVGDG